MYTVAMGRFLSRLRDDRLLCRISECWGVMETFSARLVPLLIALKIIYGSTQNANLTSDCLGATAMFTCTVSTPRVEWIAQPYFTVPIIDFANDPADIGRSRSNNFGPSEGITIRHTDIHPLTTVMEVQRNLINESFMFSCVPARINFVPLTSEAVTGEYITFSPSQVDILSIEQMCDASFQTGSIRVTISASQCVDEGVSDFIVNCSGSTCISESVDCPATDDVTLLTVTLSAGMCGSHEVNAYAVNRCADMISDPITMTVVPPTRIMSIEQVCGACFRNGHIGVTFSASECAYEGVTGFIVNCSGSTCISERVECPVVIDVSVLTDTLVGAKCGSHEVNEYAINRTSDPATRTVGAPIDECLLVLILLNISVMLIFACGIVIGVLSYYYCKKKAKLDKKTLEL